jgi:hypothetical protein
VPAANHPRSSPDMGGARVAAEAMSDPACVFLAGTASDGGGGGGLDPDAGGAGSSAGLDEELEADLADLANHPRSSPDMIGGGAPPGPDCQGTDILMLSAGRRRRRNGYI